MLGYFGDIFKQLSNKIELKSATSVQHGAQKRQHEPKGAKKYIIMEAYWHHFRIIFWSSEPSWFFVNFWRVPDAQKPVKHIQKITFLQNAQMRFRLPPSCTSPILYSKNTKASATVHASMALPVIRQPLGRFSAGSLARCSQRLLKSSSSRVDFDASWHPACPQDAPHWSQDIDQERQNEATKAPR